MSMEPRELCVIERCLNYGERDGMKSERNMYILVAQWLLSSSSFLLAFFYSKFYRIQQVVRRGDLKKPPGL